MTLDEFKSCIDEAAKDFKRKVVTAIVQGVTAKLDENIMLAIVTNAVEQIDKEP